MSFMNIRKPANVFDRVQPKVCEIQRPRKFEQTPLEYKFNMIHTRKQGEYEVPQYFSRFSNAKGECFNGYGLGNWSIGLNVHATTDMLPTLPEGMAPKRFY